MFSGLLLVAALVVQVVVVVVVVPLAVSVAVLVVLAVAPVVFGAAGWRTTSPFSSDADCC